MSSFVKKKFCYSSMMLLALLSANTMFNSCRKEADNVVLPVPEDSIQSINKWVLDSMKHYYYYSGNIDNSVTLEGSTETYFKKLIYPSDKFSWISNGQNITAPKSCFDLYGFHYILVQNAAYSSANLIGVISLVATESAADRAGYERGFYFSKVNGIAITPSNVSIIESLLNSGKTVSLTIIENLAGSWIEKTPNALPATVFEERPVYTTRVFEKNNKKTGYIFYRLFNEKFDLDLLNAFDKLKAKNVTELIIDLRYNAGGSVASCAKLSAMICKANAGNVFGIYKGNNTLQTVSQTFEKAIGASSNNSGKAFSELVAKRLNIDKVYILSTAATASAAELLINNLKPYINVLHIGENTFGKDFAAILITDRRIPKKVAWSMQPIAYKLYNAQQKGDYENGLVPQIAENEFDFLPLSPLSSPDDLLVKKALIQIYGDNKVTTEQLRISAKAKPMKAGLVFFNSVKSAGKGTMPEILP